ncbi:MULTISPECIES: EF-hand domain-containing protein [unclassified Kitasatospora]|uniref:EF-hand domain-containing protein n=2 Tax=Kitasatospora TaxID=2063 RepID=UPI00247BBC71|nr:Ca2+-binding EF-hand superfamily protein [Kitasatospora sp. MAA19]
MSSMRSAREQFDEIDTDHNGYISPDELKTYLMQNPKVSEANAKATIQYADENSDGRISFEEFSDLIR